MAATGLRSKRESIYGVSLIYLQNQFNTQDTVFSNKKKTNSINQDLFHDFAIFLRNPSHDDFVYLKKKKENPNLSYDTLSPDSIMMNLKSQNID